MEIIYHKKFEKKFKKLNDKIKNKVKSTIKKFTTNPGDKNLRNHALKGKLEGKRAIWVTGDIRIIFQEMNDYVLVIMLDVGTHTHVYE